MIVPMKHITLFALKRDEKPIMKALQDAGVVQIERYDRPDADAALTSDAQSTAAKSKASGASQIYDTSNTANASHTSDAAFLSEESEFRRLCEKELSDRDADVSRVKTAISKLSSYMEKPSFIAPLPETDEATLASSVAGALEVAGQLEALTLEISRCKTEKQKHKATIAQLAPFADMDVAIESIRSTRHVGMVTGTIRAERISMLDEAGVAYQSFGDANNRPLIVAVPKSNAAEVNDALKACGFAECTLPALCGTPSANIFQSEQKITALDEDMAGLHSKIEKLGENAELLKRGFDGAVIERDRARARLELFATRETFSLTGWVRSDEVEKLRSAVDAATDVSYIDLRDPYDEEKPPTALKNSKFFAPFTFVTDMYSPPDPRGFDPTVVMAPFYLLFFGLMMSDTGYGAVITILCALALKIKKPSGGFEKICRILVWGGISTMVCGLLAGTCFGMSWHDIFGEAFPFPLLDSMKDPMIAMVIYCGLGFGQIVTGMIVSIVLHLKKGDWQTALFDIGSWLMIFAGIGLVFVLKGGAVYAAYALIGIGLIMIIGFGGRAKKGFGRVTGGLGKLYDITGFFSDVLSYARVFALGLATGVMGSVFNMIGSMINSAFAGIPVIGAVLGFIVAGALLVVLHMFCIAINALGAFIHCARLQFIEYYNRFYTPGGKNFAPLDVKTKHNRIRQ